LLLFGEQKRRSTYFGTAKFTSKDYARKIRHGLRLVKTAFLGYKIRTMDAQPPEQPANTYNFKSILLVDDDKQLATALQWILADENFLVDVAYDGAEALDKVKTTEYEAVVCDLVMPKLQGDEFYRQARQLRPELADRFIFMTGHATHPQIQEFLKTCESKYLVKPFPVQQLIECIRQLLG